MPPWLLSCRRSDKIPRFWVHLLSGPVLLCLLPLHEDAYRFHFGHYFGHKLMRDDSPDCLNMWLVLLRRYRIYGFTFPSVAYLHCGAFLQNKQ